MECISCYKGNYTLISNDGKEYKDKFMAICDEKNCFNYICLNCNDDDKCCYYCDIHKNYAHDDCQMHRQNNCRF